MVKVKVLVTQSCLSAAPRTHQAPLSMGFSRQEYWSGLPFPSQGIFLTQGIKPGPPTLQADSLPLSHQGSTNYGKRKKKVVNMTSLGT